MIDQIQQDQLVLEDVAGNDLVEEGSLVYRINSELVSGSEIPFNLVLGIQDPLGQIIRTDSELSVQL